MPRRRASCPTCGGAVPKAARFCPECGTRLAQDSTAVLATPADEAGRVPASVTTSEPRRFGTALARARARAVYAVDVFATRTRAGREVARVRHELLQLGAERDRRVRELGETVYRDDRKGTKRLRAELAELDARIERKEADMGAIATEARAHVERARLEVRPTEMVEIPEPPSPSPDPDPSPQPEPPTPTPVPEPGPIPPVPEPYPPPDEATPPEPARIPEPGPLNDAREKDS